MPKELAEELEEYINSLYGIKSTDRLFEISKSAFHKTMTEYSKKAGVKRITIHGLRHPYVKLKLKILSAYFSRTFGAKVLDFPLDFKSVIGIYTHLFDKHICKCLC